MNEIDPELKSRLDKLLDTPERSRQKTALGRAKFIFQAQEMQQPVSQGSKSRHKGWKLFPPQTRKEPFRMSAFATILLIFSLVFGGSTATLAAAQSAIPNQLLYAVKIASEETRAHLTTQTQSRIKLTLSFASRRMGEFENLVQQGITPTQALMNRYQNQVELALRLASVMEADELTPILLRARETLQKHEQKIAKLLLQKPSDPVLKQMMVMIQNQLQLCQNGLDDPYRFRNELQTRLGEKSTPQPGQGDQNGTGNQLDGNPWIEGSPTPYSGYGDGNGGNPWTDETPTPGSGYGDGNGGNPYTTGTPTPGSGYGDANGGNPYTTGTPTPGSGYGGGTGANPYTTGTPTPGSGYGPGPK